MMLDVDGADVSELFDKSLSDRPLSDVLLESPEARL